MHARVRYPENSENRESTKSGQALNWTTLGLSILGLRDDLLVRSKGRVGVPWPAIIKEELLLPLGLSIMGCCLKRECSGMCKFCFKVDGTITLRVRVSH